MKNKLNIFKMSLIIFFSLISCLYAENIPQKRPGHILYKLKENLPASRNIIVKNFLRAHRSWPKKILRNQEVVVEVFENLKGKTEETICRQLIATGAVEFAEPDYLISPEQTPNDPNFSNQWHHSKINTPLAWDITTGNEQVIVAVCDTGVLTTHQDLADNLILPGFNTVDGSTNVNPISGHGTATSGCVAAVGNNGIGVTGMAWKIKVLPIRVSNLSDGSAYYSDIAEAINYAADHGAKVISISYGVGGSYTIDNAAKYARKKGALVFVAAGNSNQQVNYSDFSSFVLVGATDSKDAKASFSNYGASLDVVAPGTSIVTTNSSGTYSTVSGTSFSTPLAAGLAALIYSINPSFTPEEVENFIFSTAEDLGTLGKDIYFGYGRINALKAVQQALIKYKGNTPPQAYFEPSTYTGLAPLSVTFDASGSSDIDGSIVSYEWNFGDGDTAVGKIVSHTFSKAGSYSVTLTVTDNLNASFSVTKSITVASPLPPFWQISPVSGVSASENNGILSVEFVTAQDVNYYHATRKVDVQANTTYRLSGYIKTDNLIDNKGVCLEAVDSRGWTYLAKSTPKITGTKDWTYVEVVFTTTPETKQMVIRARRISGTGTVQGKSYFKEAKLEKL